MTSIVFADLAEFTPLSDRFRPMWSSACSTDLFSHFDALAERHGLEKIKTIGDCYMAAAGVPDPHPDHARRAALLALDMRDAVSSWTLPDRSRPPPASDRHQFRTRRRGGDRDQALPLRSLRRRGEHGEPHGVPRRARRDPDHERDPCTPC